MDIPDDCGGEHPFRCADCGQRLFWDDLDPGVLLVCGNPQCPAAASTIPVWQAQEHRVARGVNVPAPGPGRPRPVMGGLPVPYVTPVSQGRPWWRLTHGARLLACQNEWRCQVCGLGLPERACVVLDGDRVLSDTALHRDCCDLAVAHCPHVGSDAGLRVREVSRGDLVATDGQPVTVYAPWRTGWRLRAHDTTTTSPATDDAPGEAAGLAAGS